MNHLVDLLVGHFSGAPGDDPPEFVSSELRTSFHEYMCNTRRNIVILYRKTESYYTTAVGHCQEGGGKHLVPVNPEEDRGKRRKLAESSDGPVLLGKSN